MEVCGRSVLWKCVMGFRGGGVFSRRWGGRLGRGVQEFYRAEVSVWYGRGSSGLVKELLSILNSARNTRAWGVIW